MVVGKLCVVMCGKRGFSLIVKIDVWNALLYAELSAPPPLSEIIGAPVVGNFRNPHCYERALFPYVKSLDTHRRCLQLCIRQLAPSVLTDDDQDFLVPTAKIL